MPKKRVRVSLRQSSPPPEATSDEGAASDVVAVDVPAPESQQSPVESAVFLEATPAREIASLDAFVSGAALALEQAAIEIPTAQLEEWRRRGPDGYRELTVYLPEELAQKLSVHCLEHNLELNRLVAAAVELHLNGPAAPRLSERRVRERAVAIAARTLLADLAAWVRETWEIRARWPARTSAAPAS